MPVQYSSAQKAAIMTLLERNGGNIQLTAQQTGVPYRTIYDWQRDMLPILQQYAPVAPPPRAAETPTFENDLDALGFIRQNLLGELSRLSVSLQYDSGFSTPYQRALVLSQLMDRLLKLDVHLKPYSKDALEEERELLKELLDEGDAEDDEEVINYERAYEIGDGDDEMDEY